MSVLSSYFIAVHTGADYTSDTYDAAAGHLANLLTTLLGDRAVIDQLTHNATLDSCTSEVEIMLEASEDGRELVGQAVVDILSSQKLKMDKAKLSKLVKAHANAAMWPKMRVEKRLVPDQS